MIINVDYPIVSFHRDIYAIPEEMVEQFLKDVKASTTEDMYYELAEKYEEFYESGCLVSSDVDLAFRDSEDIDPYIFSDEGDEL